MKTRVVTQPRPVQIDLDAEASVALHEFLSYNLSKATRFYIESPKGQAMEELFRQLGAKIQC